MERSSLENLLIIFICQMWWDMVGILTLGALVINTEPYSLLRRCLSGSYLPAMFPLKFWDTANGSRWPTGQYSPNLRMPLPAGIQILSLSLSCLPQDGFRLYLEMGFKFLPSTSLLALLEIHFTIPPTTSAGESYNS